MWNGAPGSSTASAPSSAAANVSTSVNAPSVVACMWAKSIDRPDPCELVRDVDDVVDRAELAHAAHHLEAERDGALLRLQALPERGQPRDDVVQRPRLGHGRARSPGG